MNSSFIDDFWEYEIDTKKDSFYVFSESATNGPSCMYFCECNVLNDGIDSVVEYIRFLVSKAVYNIIDMEFTTVDDEIFASELEEMKTIGITGTEIFDRIENICQTYDEKLDELKISVDNILSRLDEVISQKNKTTKRNELEECVNLYNKLFKDVCCWEYHIHLCSSAKEFVEWYEQEYVLPMFLNDYMGEWKEIKNGVFNDKCKKMLDTFICNINECTL